MEAEVREKSLRDGRSCTAGCEDGGRGPSQGGGTSRSWERQEPPRRHTAHERSTQDFWLSQLGEEFVLLEPLGLWRLFGS